MADDAPTSAPADRPDAGLPTAAPPVGARVVAFVAIVVAGAAGGFIGWAVADLQCEGDCTAATSIAALFGASLAAVGVGIVSVLALRAMNEWRTLQARGGPTPPPTRPVDPRTAGPRPRVR